MDNSPYLDLPIRTEAKARAERDAKELKRKVLALVNVLSCRERRNKWKG